MVWSSLKTRLRGYLARRNALVLAYHSVVARPLPFPVWHHMHVSRFEEQIAYLARNQHCLSVSDLLANLAHGRSQPYAVAVTFDDGFANNLHIALPILRKYGVPATFFLTTDSIGTERLLWPERLACILEAANPLTTEYKGAPLALRDAAGKGASYRVLVKECQRLPPEGISQYLTELAVHARVDESAFPRQSWWSEYRVMSWNEVHTLANSEGVQIGAHTMTHPRLSRIADSDAQREIVGGKQVLEAQLGSIACFAYPNGGQEDYTQAHRQMAIDAGYRAAFTAQQGTVTRQTDPFQIPRIGIGGDVDMYEFEYALNGGAAFESNSVQWT